MSDLTKLLNVYEFETILPGSEKSIKYKGLSTNIMKKLLVHENEKDPLKEQEILDHILELCILDDISIKDMYVLDRYYLMIKIREATKGDTYAFQYDCPKCKSQNINSINLKELLIEKPEIENEYITLFNKKLKIKMGHPLRKDQIKYYNTINKSSTDMEKQIDIVLADLASHVKEILIIENDEEKILNVSDSELVTFIGDLPETEKKIFDDWIDKNKFGLELNYTLKCNSCDFEERKELPMHSFFS